MKPPRNKDIRNFCIFLWIIRSIIYGFLFYFNWQIAAFVLGLFLVDFVEREFYYDLNNNTLFSIISSLKSLLEKDDIERNGKIKNN